MADKLITLSEADVRLLQDRLTMLERQVQNVLTRRQSVEQIPHSTDIYLAKVPVGGIPARSDLVCGAADCEIYRSVFDGTTNTLEVVPGNTQRVLNISEEVIEDTTEYVVVGKDKAGSWYIMSLPGAQGPAGGVLQVQELDGSPNLFNINLLQFDQADGLVVSSAGTGKARIDISLRTSFRPGTVNSGNHHLGQKQFDAIFMDKSEGSSPGNLWFGNRADVNAGVPTPMIRQDSGGTHLYIYGDGQVGSKYIRMILSSGVVETSHAFKPGNGITTTFVAGANTVTVTNGIVTGIA